MRLAFLFVTMVAAAPAMAAEPDARAMMIDTSGKPVGEVLFRDGAHGLLIDIDLRGLPPGPHGTHVHLVGTCDDASAGFKASGGHVKGHAAEHGLMNPKGPEAGDLPNVYAAADGTARAQFFATEMSLEGRDGRERLLDGDGSAVVVHAKADDHVSQPIGGAGDRIACGVIKRGQ